MPVLGRTVSPAPMIQVTRLNHSSLILNSDLIESIEMTPDTVISLTTGVKLVVLEPASEVVRRVIEFRRAVYDGILRGSLIAQQDSSDGNSKPTST